MKNLLEKLKNSMANTFFLFPVILLTHVFFCNNAFGQVTNKVYGRWKIDNIAFVSPPGDEELNEIIKLCRHRIVRITKSKFIFKAGGCFLFRSINHFKIIKQYTLSFEKASSSNDYADKTIDYIFDGRRKKSIEVCKTNYTFESNEGEVPELEIFIIDDNHIILNQGDNMIYLTRD